MVSDAPEGYMSGEDFARHVHPLTEVLRALVVAARGDRPDDGAPAAASAAMRELGSQRKFPSGKEGVVDVALTLTSQRVYAGEDHMLAVCSLLDVESESFVWSLPVLGRAALEAFGGAAHLSEPGIAERLRAGRVVNELIASAEALDNLHAEVASPTKRVAERRAQATAMGLTPAEGAGGRQKWFEEARPGYRRLVRALFEPERLGDAVYNAWSAVAHSSSWGLSQNLGELESLPLGAGVRAPVVLSFRDVLIVGLAMILGHRRAIEHQRAWKGWPFANYERCFQASRSTIQGLTGDTSLNNEVGEAQPLGMVDILWVPTTPARHP